jgi:hypothetical protein
MQASIVLTVAQGKRLIARAVAVMPEVRDALDSGLLAIGRGTTNAYVAEEILGEGIVKGEYVAGRTLPPGVSGELLGTGQCADIVLKHGQRQEGVTVAQAVQQMRAGDVFIKGGNALDYRRKVVGVLIGHPMGGTCGDNYGAIISRKVHLIIPIGLEKLVVEDIEELSRASRCPDTHPDAPPVSLFPITGSIVTEIEALRILCGVSAHLLAAGGVAGAEGAIRLLLEGEKADINVALKLAQRLQDEPNMGLRAMTRNDDMPDV